MSKETLQETGAENAPNAESNSSANKTPGNGFDNAVKGLMTQSSSSGMFEHAQNLVPKSVEDFIDVIERLRKLGDKSRLALIFLFIVAEERGDYLLWGYATLKDLVVKGCGMSSSWFYRHYNAGRIALIVKEHYSDLPIVCLELLAKIPESTANREELILRVLDASSSMTGGISEANVAEAMKEIVPKVVKSGDSEKVGKMKSIIRSKDAIIKELGDIDPEDGVLKAKVATLEAATKDLLIAIK